MVFSANYYAFEALLNEECHYGESRGTLFNKSFHSSVYKDMCVAFCKAV